MNKVSLGFRDVMLATLILAAIGHAHWAAILPVVQPHFAGLGRLGRDLIRRPTGEEITSLKKSQRPFALPAMSR
jgi:hypothetical protein